MFNIFNSSLNKSICDERYIAAEMQDALEHIHATGLVKGKTQKIAKNLVETTLNLPFEPRDLTWNKFLVRYYLGLREFRNNKAIECITGAIAFWAVGCLAFPRFMLGLYSGIPVKEQFYFCVMYILLYFFWVPVAISCFKVEDKANFGRIMLKIFRLTDIRITILRILTLCAPLMYLL